MSNVDDVISHLSADQKKILVKAQKSGSTILFNIKGMVQVLHDTGPFDFIEMGFEDIEVLKKRGLIKDIEHKEAVSVLEGRSYVLSDLGKKVANALNSQK